MAEGYVARLPSSVVARIAPRGPTPGEAIGRGIAELGQTLGGVAEQNARVEEQIAQSNFRIAEQIKARERTSVSFALQGELSDRALAVQEQVAELRGPKSKPGAEGHEEAVQQLIEKESSAFMQRASDRAGGDPDVLDRIGASVKSWGNGVLGKEMDWAREQRAKAEGYNGQKAADRLANEQLTNPDMAKAGEGLVPLYRIIDSSDQSPAVKTITKDLITRQVFGGTLDGYIARGNYNAVYEILQGETLNAIFTPEQKKIYAAHVKVGRAEQQRAVEEAQEQAQKQALEGLKVIKTEIEGGKEAVLPSRINAALDQARAAGVDASVLKEYEYLGEASVQMGVFRGMSNAALEGEVRKMRARMAAGGVKPEEQGAIVRRLDRAEKVLGSRDTEKGESLSARWKTGGEGEQAIVMGELVNLPQSERWRVADKMGEGMGKLALVATLPPAGRVAALEGGRIRAARPDAFIKLAGETSKALTPDALKAKFDAQIGPIVRNSLKGRYKDALEAVMDYYVGARARAGGGGDMFNSDTFANAVNTVFGARTRADGQSIGGLAKFRNRTVELPQGWTADEFDRHVSRYDFGAKGAIYSRQRQRVDNADVLKNYSLIVDHVDADGSVYYRLEDGRGGWLADANVKGRPFLLPMTRTPGGR